MSDFSIYKLKRDRLNFESYYFENKKSNDSKHDIFHEYLHFSRFWQHAFIQSDYIIDTGNFETANCKFLYSFEANIRKHPILWKLFRFIFAV